MHSGGTANLRSYHPAVYAEHDGGGWTVAAGAGYSRHNIDTARQVAVSSTRRQATAGYTADQYTGAVRGGFDLPPVRSASIEAFGEIRFSRLTRGAFSEVGAASASLTDVSRAESDSFRLVLGTRTDWTPRGGASWIRPVMTLGWAREWLDVRGGSTAALSGAPTRDGFERFTVSGPGEARNSAVIGLGTAAELGDHGRAFVTYDGRLTTRGSEHGITAGARISW